MTPASCPARRPDLLGAACTVLLVTGAAGDWQAQETRPGPGTTVAWDIGAVQSGWCLHFLMHPEASRTDLPRGITPARATDRADLHRALATLVQNEPQYGEWTPADLCTVVAGRLAVGERVFEQGDGGEPLILVWWAVAAVGPEGQTTAARYFGTNSTGLKQQMKSSLLELERVKAKLEPLPDSEERRLRLELEGATLYFDGHVTPDTIPGQRDQRWHWVAPGPQNSLWEAEASASPEATGGVAGALRIQGKRRLAVILTESPVRIFGPGFTGGSFTLRLHR